MKRFLTIFSLIITFVVFPTAVWGLDLGQDMVNQAGQQAGFAPATETSLAENIGAIVGIILSIVGVLFTVLMVYGGYLWMTARGADEQVEKAQNVIKAAIIGIIITLGAYSITAFVVPRVLERATTMAPVEAVFV